MRNQHPGYCYRCGGWVEPQAGHFERYNGYWRTQHAQCAIKYRGTNFYTVVGFTGQYAFLANEAPTPFEWKGVFYPDVSTALQQTFGTDTPGIPALTDVAGMLLAKFSINSWAARALEDTGTARLIHLSDDLFWGQSKGEGENTLGELLMRVRSTRRRETYVPFEEPRVCRCGKGYMSHYDHKCGHCRSKSERRNHETLLRRLHP